MPGGLQGVLGDREVRCHALVTVELAFAGG